MPQLQIMEDPYAVSTGAAVNNLASGMMGPSPDQLANYQVLAARMREADAQQRKLAQEMQLAQQKSDWESADRKQRDTAADAAGRYWGYATPAPVNGAPQDMERYYREQNYRDQMARMMTSSGKSAEDVAKAMNEYQAGFQAAHPAPSATPYPAAIAGNPTAMKKFDEERAKDTADNMLADEKSRKAAAQLLPQILDSRNAYHEAAAKGGVGKVMGSDPGRWAAWAFNGDAAKAQDAYEKASSFWQARQIAQNNQGLGAMSNYEQQLARQPFAKLNDYDEATGMGAIDRQLAYNLQTLGVPGSVAPKVVSAIAGGSVPGPALDMLVKHLQAGDTTVLDEFMQKYGGQ